MTRKKLVGFFGVIAVAAAMTAACSQSDAGITTAVKSKFAADDTVKAYQINVDTKDKIVTLKGEVDTAAARDKAVEIARATDGVRDVVECARGYSGDGADERCRRPRERHWQLDRRSFDHRDCEIEDAGGCDGQRVED